MFRDLGQILSMVAGSKKVKDENVWVDKILKHCEIHSDYLHFVNLRSNPRMLKIRISQGITIGIIAVSLSLISFVIASTINFLFMRMLFLETTNYNYKDLSKLYKEQVQLGYSKLLPQLALGHSQGEILAELKFEKDILDLSSIMVPAQMSSTMSGKDKGKNEQSNQNNNQKIIEEKEAGRKELPDDQKSDKTLANREAMS